ncbi:MAG: phosphatase PAP2 family protein [Fidelibacterota bacterium]
MDRLRLTLTDKLLIIYELILSALIMLSSRPGIATGKHLTINAVLIIAILLLNSIPSSHRSMQFLHRFYPIFLMAWLYPQACELRWLFHGQEFDAILLNWERIIIGRELYLDFARWPLPVLEFFHGIYFFYYLGLFLFAFRAWQQQHPLVPAYVFTLTFSSLLHHIFIIAFPASGPPLLRPDIMPDGVIFIPMMNWIYNNVDRGGGAFPSLHVASTVIFTIFALRFSPRFRTGKLVFAILILCSTVIGSFHYTIDTATGAWTGLLAYFAGTWLFQQWEQPR